MFSPAQRHQRRITQNVQRQASQVTCKPSFALTGSSVPDADALVGQQLACDLQRLRAIPAGEQRNTLKRELLPTYLPVLEHYQQSGACYPNPVLVQVVIWLFDCGQMSPAIQFGLLAVTQQQPMPEGWKRDIRNYFADAVREWAEKQVKLGHSPQPYFDHVFTKILDEQWPLPSDSLSKYHKFAGLQYFERQDWQQAHDHFLHAERCAMQVSAGVKCKIKTCQKELIKEQETRSTPTATAVHADVTPLVSASTVVQTVAPSKTTEVIA